MILDRTVTGKDVSLCKFFGKSKHMQQHGSPRYQMKFIPESDISYTPSEKQSLANVQWLFYSECWNRGLQVIFVTHAD